LESRDVSNSLAHSPRLARLPNTDKLTEGETLPRGSPVSVDLPAPGTKRWVARRKAAVVAAVRSGAIGLEEACRRFELSEEEFHSWERVIESHGVAGLRITRLQIYRDAPLLTPPKPQC
jgi:Protein of unknown function (DUF1153)